MRKGAPRVKVRGRCAAGHVTETEAPRRRTTWTGTCPTEGCGLQVTARRIPTGEPAPREKATTTLPSGAKVRRKVRFDERRDGRAAGEPAGVERTDGDEPAGAEPTAEPEQPKPADDVGFERGDLEHRADAEDDDLLGIGI